jgi:hypothetical protein
MYIILLYWFFQGEGRAENKVGDANYVVPDHVMPTHAIVINPANNPSFDYIIFCIDIFS